MRAVEKNILVVSTCELRSKREEAVVVNGAPDRWENGKESDVNMDLVDKSNVVVSEANVLNGNESVESLLNELEAMKTPETKPDEVKTELKEHLITQVTDEVIKSDPITEEPQSGSQSLITDTPQTPVTDSTEVVEQVKTDVETVLSESIVDSSQEQTPVACDEIQPVVIKEKINENPIEDHKELSNDINIENIEPETKEPIIESNTLDLPDLIPSDADRVEGSIIHLQSSTPDSDDKEEPDVATSQFVTELEKSNDGIESMEVQVEEVNKTSEESEENCDNVEKLESTETTSIVEGDKQDVESTVEVPVAMDTIALEMDVEPEIEPEKIEHDVTQKEAVNEQETKTSEPNVDEHQGQSENKLTESE